MGIELDATDAEMIDENDEPQDTWNEAEDDDLAEDETASLINPQRVARTSPALAAQCEQLRLEILKWKERQSQLENELTNIRQSLGDSYERMGKLVVESGVVPGQQLDPLHVEPTETKAIHPIATQAKPPTATMSHGAPIEMLRLPPATETTLKERNGIKTVADLKSYLESNGSLSGLDGVGAGRAKKIEAKYYDFISSQQ